MEAACTTLWEVRMANQQNQSHGLRIAAKQKELRNRLSPEQLADDALYRHLEVQEDLLLESQLPSFRETSFVTHRLETFTTKLPALKREGYDIRYFVIQNTANGYRINVLFSNGKSMLLQDLPAGYRRLYSIAFDMAYRAYILNGDKEPTGIVVIDEIDLHLHPSLEQEVVAALHATFPQVQFILSSYSPAVISNLNTAKRGNEEPANCVLFMQEGQEQADPLPNIYGLDYNAALRDFMDTPASSGEIRRLRNEYLTFCSLGLDKEAESTMAEIKKQLGREDHPILEQIRKDAEAYEVH